MVKFRTEGFFDLLFNIELKKSGGQDFLGNFLFQFPLRFTIGDKYLCNQILGINFLLPGNFTTGTWWRSRRSFRIRRCPKWLTQKFRRRASSPASGESWDTSGSSITSSPMRNPARMKCPRGSPPRRKARNRGTPTLSGQGPPQQEPL